MTEEDSSPVLAALRMSRKGRLNYDRYWDRSGSVERVIREVTSHLESVSLYSPSCGVLKEHEGAGQGDCVDAAVKLSTKKRTSRQTRQKKTGKIDKDESENIEDSPPPAAPLCDYHSPAPVTIAINRECERDIRDSRNIVMSSDSAAATDLSRSVLSERDLNTTLDQSLNSTSSHQDVFDSSIFIYTPDIVKSVARRSPRVDLVKIRLPDSLLVGREKKEETALVEEEIEVSEEVPGLIPPPPREDEGSCIISPPRPEVVSRLICPLSPVEDELARYQMQAKEEAGKRLHERDRKSVV